MAFFSRISRFFPLVFFSVLDGFMLAKPLWRGCRVADRRRGSPGAATRSRPLRVAVLREVRGGGRAGARARSRHPQSPGSKLDGVHGSVRYAADVGAHLESIHSVYNIHIDILLYIYIAWVCQ